MVQQLDFDISQISDALVRQIKMADFSLTGIVSGLASGFMIFGGVIPYIPQYMQIRSSQNAEGFSLFVCFTLLVANTLRIFFWFGHHFELPLLIQSIVMIIAMFVMIQLCTAVKKGTEIISSKTKQFTDSPTKDSNDDDPSHKAKLSKKAHHRKAFTDFEMSDFWQWTDFSSYLQCMLTISLLVGLLTMALISSTLYVEGLGLAAVLTEAMLGLPQFYANFVNQSTKGMSVQMVMLWLAGDIFKTLYFIVRSAPLQFWLCGTLQVSLDFAILFQVMYYGSSKSAVQ